MGAEHSAPRAAVFLSYASQDAEAARRICDALRGAGVEVWFDADGGLEHGDEWDAKIRRQIKECVLFLPVISANTQAREEGYFRIEWDLAAERARGIASGVAFILPVVIDTTREPDALVPDRFRAVQWTRLPGGAVTPEVLARFLKLWSHRAGVVKHDAAKAEVRVESAPPVVPPARRPGFLTYLFAGLAVVVIGLIAFVVLRPRRSPEEVAKLLATVQSLAEADNKRAAAAPVTPARQLVARARAMSIDKFNSTADDYTAAEGLLQHALDLDPRDAEAWAASSILNRSFHSRGFDRSPERSVAARTQAERALKLDPDSIEAMYAMGLWQRPVDVAAAERSFRAVLARQPDHAGALFGMSNLADRANHVDESLAYLAQLTKRPESAALAHYLEFLTYFTRARFDEAERAVRASIEREPSVNSRAGLAMVLLTAKGDTDGAIQALTAEHGELRNEPRLIWQTALIQLCRHAPDEALATLDRQTDPFIQDSWYVGPTAYFVGRAQALAGRPEAAQLAWQSGTALVRARLRDAPERRDLHLVLGELLALQGQTEDALREARTVNQLDRGGTPPWFMSPVRIYAALGRADDAVPLLAKMTPPVEGEAVGWPLTPALLRLDPMWDKLRGDARFQALCGGSVGAAPPPANLPPEVAKARDLLETLEATREDFALAEDILKGVLAREPGNAEAWAIYSQLNARYARRGWDRSPARHELANSAAQRALRLDPHSFEARVAQAGLGNESARELVSSEQAWAALHRERPGDQRVMRALAAVLRNEDRIDEAVALWNQSAAQPGGDALALYSKALAYLFRGDPEAAESAVHASLAQRPFSSSQVIAAWLLVLLHGDLDGAQAQLDQVPVAALREDRGCFFSYYLHVLRREYNPALAQLETLPREWLEDNWYTGPKALLAGDALALAGRADAAAAQWREALRVTEARLAASPSNTLLIYNQAELLAKLGQRDAAAAKLKLGLQLEGIDPAKDPAGARVIHVLIALGRNDEAIEMIRRGQSQASLKVLHTRAILRIDPRYDPLRGDPRFAALAGDPRSGH